MHLRMEHLSMRLQSERTIQIGHSGCNGQTGTFIVNFTKIGTQYLRIVMKYTGKEMVMANPIGLKMVLLLR